MAKTEKRPAGGRGRRGVFRRAKRAKVPVGTQDFNPPGANGDDGGEGSAGVREPRRPKPLGPMSGAGALPIPPPATMITLPDPRR